ncbi:MAG: SRPBCC domain-containing protein [Ignavibacteriae bacterium]|nr:SRPBCC domain-containing protein [Ignavibacteriota bacterium]
MTTKQKTTTETEPFIIERTYEAPVDLVWKAITEKERMKQWYFDLKEFKPEVGFEFQFTGGTEERPYLHLCKVLEVVPQKKLSYSWVYDGYEGYSVVTFELFPEGQKTRLRLTHTGLETFPASNPDLVRKNFVDGWTSLIGESLKSFLEKTT